MKIAVIGTTLQAGVLSSLLAEYGNEVYLYRDAIDHFLDRKTFQDPHLLHRLHHFHNSDLLKIIADEDAFPDDIECYLFCYEPQRLEKAINFVKKLPSQFLNKKRLMINCGTFGLYGTEELQSFSPDDYWVYLPDTAQEGNAINSFIQVSKVIVGVEDNDAKALVKELLRPFFPLESQYLWMPILDAELVKMSISGMLATRISYMNDLANVAEKIGVDIINVKQGLAADSRIGASYLSPGVGFGGENFSHDILLLSSLVSESGMRGKLLEQVWEINEDQKEVLFRKLWHFYQTDLAGKKIAIWGATFKEGTSSTYNSPIHKMITALLAQDAEIQLYDPQGMIEIIKKYGEDRISYYDNKYEALTKADALCVITSWKEFYSLDYQLMKEQMNVPLILDGRNIYDPEFMRAEGFIYQGVGRK